MGELVFEAAARSDAGRVRRQNEDAVLELTPVQFAGEKGVRIVAVADGVGGGPAGELASRAAVDGFGSAFGATESEAVEATLHRAVDAANLAVCQLQDRFAGDRPASTLVAAAIHGLELWIANVGDSRAYLCRHGRSIRLTVDHSLEQEMLATASARRARKYRHVITRSLGVGDVVNVDVFGPRLLEAGDVLVLCSDGLYGVVDDSEIARHCTKMRPASAADALIRLANERGGHDNISVVIVRLVVHDF